jgi:hypothetical protein
VGVEARIRNVEAAKHFSSRRPVASPAYGRPYKKYCRRANAVERVEGSSERTKYQELVWKIPMANNIGHVADAVRGKVEETFKGVLP